MKIKLKDILFNVAKNTNGELITARDAEKGIDYYCPECNGEFILKKSGNTGRNSKRPHYAHKTDNPNCTPESVLHYSFKMMLAGKIQNNIDNNLPINFYWNCIFCTEKHSGNLLRHIRSVKVEYNLGDCIPDIVLFNNFGKIIAVVEIVVTHDPEEKAIDYYKENKIQLIQINLKSDYDIYEIDKKIANPDYVSFCYNPKCNICGNYLQKKIMLIIDAPCWYCKKTMKIATIVSGNGGVIRGISNNIYPSNFTREEIQFARIKDVLLKKNYNKITEETYLANTCQHCNKSAGDSYLYTDYIWTVQCGKFLKEYIEIGYHCEYCEDPERIKWETQKKLNRRNH